MILHFILYKVETYNSFISQFKIYPTMKLAKKKGYEAHHIIPRAMQETPDDRCVRLTAFQHIYAHYLLALENREAAIIFALMVNLSWNKLSDLDKIDIEQLEEFARLRSVSRCGEDAPMYGVHRYGEDAPNFGKKHPGIMAGSKNPMFGRDPWNKGKKQCFSEETRHKLSEKSKTSHKGYHWYHNDERETYAPECPVGFVSGRLRRA